MAAASLSDAYVSIRPHHTRTEGGCSGPDSLVFVDIALDGDENAIRRLPADVLRNPRATLLVRANRPLATGPSAEGRRLWAVLDRWGLKMPSGLLHQPLGAPPWVEPLIGSPQPHFERARAIELEALLRWGQAIWTPSDHHYRLPSGEHARGFIKLSDAIREPRDAEVLASWLCPHLRDGLGFVLDTGTLTPIYEAAARRMSAAGIKAGKVAVLEHYPRTSVDVDDAVEYAAGDEGELLALLSVNSSGSVRDRLLGAMGRVSGLRDGLRVVVLLDKDRPTDRPEIETWSPLPGQRPLVSRGARARELCPLCAGSKASRLIPINPYTFDGMSQGQLRLIMPSVNDAAANRDFWQQCAAGPGAVAVESRSELDSPLARPTSRPMSVRIEVEGLLERDRFREIALGRIGSLISPPGRHDLLGEVRHSGRPLRADPDLVLVPAHEFAYSNFDPFWAAIAPQLAPGAELAPFPLDAEFTRPLRDRIAAAGRILIFALGAVSGHSLQRALYAVQDNHRSGEYDLQGLVLQARLPRHREWQTLCNSFDGALHAAWIAFLPESSPLRGEREILSRLEVADFEGDQKQFLEARLRLCGGEVEGEKPPLFWGSTDDSRITQNSLFGQGLDARATYAAVAAAMARARVDHDRRNAPEVRVFDLAGMIRSYYDPLIIASFFRWLGPYEAWWGWQEWEARRTIETLFFRVQEQDRGLHVLIPELLLAIAQGKLHEAAMEVVIARAEALRDEPGLPTEVAAAIDLGLHLTRKFETDPVRLGAEEPSAASAEAAPLPPSPA